MKDLSTLTFWEVYFYTMMWYFLCFRKTFRYKGMWMLSEFTAVQGIWHIAALLYALSTRLLGFILLSLKFWSLDVIIREFSSVFRYRILAVFICLTILCSKLWRVILFWSFKTKLDNSGLCWNSLLSLNISAFKNVEVSVRVWYFLHYLPCFLLGFLSVLFNSSEDSLKKVNFTNCCYTDWGL